MNFLARYFNWLQKGNPTGLVDRFPEIDPKGETSVKGIYVMKEYMLTKEDWRSGL